MTRLFTCPCCQTNQTFVQDEKDATMFHARFHSMRNGGQACPAVGRSFRQVDHGILQVITYSWGAAID